MEGPANHSDIKTFLLQKYLISDFLISKKCTKNKCLHSKYDPDIPNLK